MSTNRMEFLNWVDDYGWLECITNRDFRKGMVADLLCYGPLWWVRLLGIQIEKIGDYMTDRVSRWGGF